jgi:hypothetical protein
MIALPFAAPGGEKRLLSNRAADKSLIISSTSGSFNELSPALQLCAACCSLLSAYLIYVLTIPLLYKNYKLVFAAGALPETPIWVKK